MCLVWIFISLVFVFIFVCCCCWGRYGLGMSWWGLGYCCNNFGCYLYGVLYMSWSGVSYWWMFSFLCCLEILLRCYLVINCIWRVILFYNLYRMFFIFEIWIFLVYICWRGLGCIIGFRYRGSYVVIVFLVYWLRIICIIYFYLIVCK